MSTKEQQEWIVDRIGYKSKAEAYRVARRLNGTKAGGTKPFRVQRKFVKGV